MSSKFYRAISFFDFISDFSFARLAPTIEYTFQIAFQRNDDFGVSPATAKAANTYESEFIKEKIFV